ncbi:MAG: hypothetical protein A2X12_01855 [Bacteroidetes bacterium GWE2_29_8]|nr:MAG: hypothetical protein A2X12_01855 [Bacteroidetes bacterium GWE2_29_8]OFY23966.1 MAG: hypothetical protein A2X02_00955 [Bacteroidetes bacterium GWF2_29_10]
METTKEIKIFTSDESHKEIITAILFDNGYNNFIEEDDCLFAYIEVSLFDEAILRETLDNIEKGIIYEMSEIEDKDWNEIWEKSFQPICINNKCFIRSSFHEKSDYPYEIVIDPKMAFGTGHHETTSLIVSILLDNESFVKNKTILDMGCGTAILAILASKLGATRIDAIDNDENAVCNAIENIEINETENVNVFLGDTNVLIENNYIYDVIIANINRNVLLEQIETYTKYLKKDAILIISGFYDTDVDVLNSKAASLSLSFVDKYMDKNWTSVIYKN